MIDPNWSLALPYTKHRISHSQIYSCSSFFFFLSFYNNAKQWRILIFSVYCFLLLNNQWKFTRFFYLLLILTVQSFLFCVCIRFVSFFAPIYLKEKEKKLYLFLSRKFFFCETNQISNKSNQSDKNDSVFKQSTQLRRNYVSWQE